jgi:two-component system LytT family response regulator
MTAMSEGQPSQTQNANVRPRPPLRLTTAASSPARFLVSDGDRRIVVRHEEINWIGSAENFVELHVGKVTHLMRATLKALVWRLDPARFRRIHRKTIVNIDAVREIERSAAGWDVVMIGGERLPIARSMQEDVMTWLGGPDPTQSR